jgi:large conductance mechanosensitive channel
MALVIFCLVRGMNRLRERLPRKEAEEEAPPAPSKEEVLLTEIRDLLKEQK